MTDLPSVSLIIVSRQRQTALLRVAASLRFQSYQNFEVIIVSDAPDRAFLTDIPYAQNMLHLTFDEPNISVARNIGLAHAQGEIVAFCDDDAVPDPNWLTDLVAPFSDPTVASAGGFVRGRNGFSFQWKALLCDSSGEDFPLAVDEKAAFTKVAYDGSKFAKLQGTNCAFRRSCLTEIGGFDAGFRFFLDETDVCLRLAQAGYAAAFVPAAQVHHGFEQSALRSASRVPKSLFEIGASKRRFLEKHCAGQSFKPVKRRFFADQKHRLIRVMVEGRIEPNQVPKLMKTLHDGFETAPMKGVAEPDSPIKRGFNPLKHRPLPTGTAIVGSLLLGRKMLRKAIELSRDDRPVVLFRFSHSALFHKRFFDGRGFWVQTGGVFGKSSRRDSPVQNWTFARRTHREMGRFYGNFRLTEILMLKLFRNLAILKPKWPSKN